MPVTDLVMVELRADAYDYDLRDETALYYSAAAEYRSTNITGAGVELGRMEGDSSDNSYTLARGYAQWTKEDYLVSGDIVWANYDEKVLEEDQSLFISLGHLGPHLNDPLALR